MVKKFGYKFLKIWRDAAKKRGKDVTKLNQKVKTQHDFLRNNFLHFFIEEFGNEKSHEEMSQQELQDLLNDALDAREFEKAAIISKYIK